eukprot:TRINITY_DN90481_c0_g1_i1.p1 TRINITY_DN90481_c0_g1~~TRINITY_DN90481_c0_g1_i1.p1  ORF type:complete len:432 (-),score=104.35 TRINITY_DN90481_c0_g1_i1:421-1716(-)
MVAMHGVMKRLVPTYGALPPRRVGVAVRCCASGPREFRVRKKGEEVVFQSTLSDDEALEICRAQRTNFAENMVANYDDGQRSPNLISWLHNIAIEAQQGRSRATTRRGNSNWRASSEQASWPPHAGERRQSAPSSAPAPPIERQFQDGGEVFHTRDATICSYATDAEAYELLKKQAMHNDFVRSLVSQFEQKPWSPKQRPHAHRDAATSIEKLLKETREVTTVEVGDDLDELEDALELRRLAFSNDKELGTGELRVAGARVKRLLTSEALRLPERQLDELARSYDVCIIEGRVSPMTSLRFAAAASRGVQVLYAGSPEETALLLALFMRTRSTRILPERKTPEEKAGYKLKKQMSDAAHNVAILKTLYVEADVAELLISKVGSLGALVEMLQSTKDKVMAVRSISEGITAHDAKCVVEAVARLGFVEADAE